MTKKINIYRMALLFVMLVSIAMNGLIVDGYTFLQAIIFIPILILILTSNLNIKKNQKIKKYANFSFIYISNIVIWILLAISILN